MHAHPRTHSSPCHARMYARVRARASADVDVYVRGARTHMCTCVIEQAMIKKKPAKRVEGSTATPFASETPTTRENSRMLINAKKKEQCLWHVVGLASTKTLSTLTHAKPVHAPNFTKVFCTEIGHVHFEQLCYWSVERATWVLKRTNDEFRLQDPKTGVEMLTREGKTQQGHTWPQHIDVGLNLEEGEKTLNPTLSGLLRSKKTARFTKGRLCPQ